MTIFGSFTPLVEPISLDEAFLDVTGAAAACTATAPRSRPAIRARVLAEQGLACSVGVAPNKFLAKLASEAAKPKASRDGPVRGLGVKVIASGEELAFLHPLPVQALWGVGPKTLEKLRRRGIATVGDLAALDRGRRRRFPRQRQRSPPAPTRARRSTIGPVIPEQRPKSIGHEETFARDHHDARDRCSGRLVRMADAVGVPTSPAPASRAGP